MEWGEARGDHRQDCPGAYRLGRGSGYRAFAAAAPVAQAGTGGSFIGAFKKLTTIGSTVPANGDVNPYGMARVTKSQGSLVRDDVLISNFNNTMRLLH